MSEIEKFLHAGIKAIKAGERDKARKLLTQVIKMDQQNERAWLWLSGAVKTNEERRICLENVLTINPENEMAQKGLTKLGFPIPEPAPEPEPELESEEDWSTPFFDPAAMPEPVADPHEKKFNDVWDGSAELCAYCAHQVQRADKRCPDCKRPLIGKELVNPNRSRYLIIWVVLRAVGHAFTLLGLLGAVVFSADLPLEFQLVSTLFWIVAGFYVILSIGLTAALYLRQAWAYWLSVVILTLSIISSFAGSILQTTSPTPIQTPAAPFWLIFICALPYIVIQLLYIYMVFMAFGDFKKEKMWRIAAVSDRIKDPLTLDKIGQTLAKRNMWASAVLYWQRGAGRSPGNTAILRRLAAGYAHLGFHQRSLDTLQQALEKAQEPKVREQISKQIASLENQIQHNMQGKNHEHTISK